MTSNVASLDPVRPQKMTVPALIVASKLREALTIVAMLEEHGIDLAVAESFARAKSRMTRRPPAILITDVRLGEFNGLHLVLRGKCSRPTMSAVVMTDEPDPVLQDEAERMGATFVVKPFSKRDLLAVLCRTIAKTPEATDPVRPPYERRRTERRVAQNPPQLDLRRWERRRGLAPLLILAADSEG